MKGLIRFIKYQRNLTIELSWTVSGLMGGVYLSPFNWRLGAYYLKMHGTIGFRLGPLGFYQGVTLRGLTSDLFSVGIKVGDCIPPLKKRIGE